jgi:hypothetical protein
LNAREPPDWDTSVRIAAESAIGDHADRRFGVFRRASEKGYSLESGSAICSEATSIFPHFASY